MCPEIKSTVQVLQLNTSYFPAPPYHQGRFSDGPTWLETAAKAMRLVLDSFAFGGAVTGAPGTVGRLLAYPPYANTSSFVEVEVPSGVQQLLATACWSLLCSGLCGTKSQATEACGPTKPPTWHVLCGSGRCLQDSLICQLCRCQHSQQLSMARYRKGAMACKHCRLAQFTLQLPSLNLQSTLCRLQNF